MAQIHKDEKGIALILTITLIGLIVVLSLQFSRSTRTGLYETANFNDGIRLELIAKSGFNGALAVLYEDDAGEDSLRDSWAADIGMISAYSSNFFDGDGMFRVTVTDLAGKIQINKLVNKDGKYNAKQKDILKRFLSNEEFGLEPDEVDDIIDSIKDWIDPDDDTENFGAEDSYYKSLDPPYSCRNAPLVSLDELLLIKGIRDKPELFYGKEEVPGVSEKAPGIRDYLTVAGDDGKVNINTADRLVLKALSDELDNDDTLVDEIIKYREDEDNELNNLNWWKTALGTNDSTIVDNSLITTKSSYFEITSEGIKDNLSKEIRATVKRGNNKNITVLSWKML